MLKKLKNILEVLLNVIEKIYIVFNTSGLKWKEIYKFSHKNAKHI